MTSANKAPFPIVYTATDSGPVGYSYAIASDTDPGNVGPGRLWVDTLRS